MGAAMLIAAMTPVFGYVASPHTPHLVSHHHRRDFAPLALANGGAPLDETLSPELPIAADDECAAEADACGQQFVFTDPGAARALLATVAALYGTNYASVKTLDELVGSSSAAASLRFALALAVAAPIAASVFAQRPRLASWSVARDGAEVGCWFWLGYATQAVALETSSAGLQGFLMSLAVVVCPLLEALIDRKTQPPRVWLAAALAAAGVGALEVGGPVGAAPGDVIGLAQAAFFGMVRRRAPPPPPAPPPPSPPQGFFRLERAMRVHGGADGAAADLCTPLALTFWQLIPIAACSLAWAFGSADGAAALQTTAASLVAAPLGDPALLGGLLWTGVVTSAGCTLAEAVALGALSSSEATVVFSTEPLWGALAASYMLGETFDARCLMGGALIALGCACSGADQTDELVESAGRKLRSLGAPPPGAARALAVALGVAGAIPAAAVMIESSMHMQP
jgi:drug/metabolite transporter (DMT)-like permease